MKNFNYYFTLGLIGLFLNSGYVVAYENGSINWNKLNLSQNQTMQFQKLDKEWLAISSKIRPELIQSQKKLKEILKSPDTSDNTIRDTYYDLCYKKQRLENISMEVFLAKRHLLSHPQIDRLNKIYLYK